MHNMRDNGSNPYWGTNVLINPHEMNKSILFVVLFAIALITMGMLFHSATVNGFAMFMYALFCSMFSCVAVLGITYCSPKSADFWVGLIISMLLPVLLTILIIIG